MRKSELLVVRQLLRVVQLSSDNDKLSFLQSSTGSERIYYDT